MNSSQLLPVICDNIIISPLLGPKRCRPHAPGRIDDPWNRTSCRGAPLLGALFASEYFFSTSCASSVPAVRRAFESTFEIPIACPADRALTHTHLCRRIITLSVTFYFVTKLLRKRKCGKLIISDISDYPFFTIVNHNYEIF